MKRRLSELGSASSSLNVFCHHLSVSRAMDPAPSWGASCLSKITPPRLWVMLNHVAGSCSKPAPATQRIGYLLTPSFLAFRHCSRSSGELLNGLPLNPALASSSSL